MNKIVDTNKGFFKTVEWFLRIGVFLCFLGHGIIAFGKNITWVPYLETIGFKGETALNIMFVIGIIDIIVAFVILVKPIKLIVLWACFWTFLTALIRPLSGESIWAFIERGPNWIMPIVLYIILYKINKKIIDKD